jgi:TPR repeat protein
MSFFKLSDNKTSIKQWILCLIIFLNSHYALANEADDMTHQAGVLAKLGNFQGAELWYKKAATKGSIEANYKLAVMAIRGYVRKPNVKEAIGYYKLAAKKGHVKAQYELSVIYSSKELNAVNHEEHLFWLKKAAENKYDMAMHNLATIAARVKKYPTAVNLYTQAVKLNYSPSMLSLGNMYFYGVGLKQNYTKAFPLLNSAYEAGEEQAAFPLATLYERGLSVKKDTDKAKTLYKKAIDNGNVNAGFNLASLLIDNKESSGLIIMKRMATQGDKRAIKYLKSHKIITKTK